MVRTFSSSLYRPLRLAPDDPGMRHALGLLTVLALIAIGVASARDWPAAPSREQPRLSAIELRPAPRARARHADALRAAEKAVARRAAGRKKPRRVRKPLRRGATTSAGRGASPSSAPATPRADRDDGSGAAPVRVPPPANAGNADDDDDDEGGGSGGGEDDDSGDGGEDDD
jgi:hypothetical protein